MNVIVLPENSYTLACKDLRRLAVRESLMGFPAEVPYSQRRVHLRGSAMICRDFTAAPICAKSLPLSRSELVECGPGRCTSAESGLAPPRVGAEHYAEVGTIA